jgi:hypothetical protein
VCALACVGCDALDGIDSPEAVDAIAGDGGSSTCGVALPCKDEPGTETCVGAGAIVTCPSANRCDPSANLALPCTGSLGCDGGFCCARIPAGGLQEGDCFGSLSVVPPAQPSSGCEVETCASGALQLCSDDSQCRAGGPCEILVVQGAFQVSIGYCAGSAPGDGG